jgi:hypothetical protein
MLSCVSRGWELWFWICSTGSGLRGLKAYKNSVRWRDDWFGLADISDARWIRVYDNADAGPSCLCRYWSPILLRLNTIGFADPSNEGFCVVSDLWFRISLCWVD